MAPVFLLWGFILTASRVKSHFSRETFSLYKQKAIFQYVIDWKRFCGTLRILISWFTPSDRGKVIPINIAVSKGESDLNLPPVKSTEIKIRENVENFHLKKKLKSNNTTGKCCGRAFIWMVALGGFHPQVRKYILVTCFRDWLILSFANPRYRIARQVEWQTL